MRRISIFTSVFLFLLVLLSGCSSLSDSQKTTVTFFNAFFVKEPGEDYRLDIRMEILMPIIAERPTDGSLKDLKFMYETFQSYLQKGAESGKIDPDEFYEKLKKEEFIDNYIVGPYYITQNPLEPETETNSSQIIRVPGSSFEKQKNNEYYVNIQLVKEDGKWKVNDIDDIRKKDIINYWNNNPDAWEEIDP